MIDGLTPETVSLIEQEAKRRKMTAEQFIAKVLNGLAREYRNRGGIIGTLVITILLGKEG